MGRSLFTLLFDIAAPVGGYYLLRAFDVAPVWALTFSGLPPALRVLYLAVRRRRVDGIGVFVLLVVAFGLVTSLLTGDARLQLVRGAWFSVLFGIWMLVSLRVGHRPTTYKATLALLPGRADDLEARWADTPSFRRVWRVLTVVWGIGGLVHSGISIAMAYTLPVDVVPGLDTALSIASFVALQVITQVLLAREGTMNRMWARR
ncbi:VC0807 family protein [Amycolatopsis sp. NPDC024027]|uniref:VC0807 family protein n=1 Tax=Amycolatopsis sp. NPDC024027 TaxID=3154327 RepID=UPI0033E9C8A8